MIVALSRRDRQEECITYTIVTVRADNVVLVIKRAGAAIDTGFLVGTDVVDTFTVLTVRWFIALTYVVSVD